VSAKPAPTYVPQEPVSEPVADFSLEGLIRDERGVRVAPTSDD
jgi:hypothetical protein